MADSTLPTTTARRSEEWETLREMLVKTRNIGLKGLSERELWELPSLYRKAMSDLSLLRTLGAAPRLTQELSNICNQAHALIYRSTARRPHLSFGRYLISVLPQAVRRQASLIWATAALMTLFAIIGWVHCVIQPDLPKVVLSPQMIGSIEKSLATAREQSELGLAAQIPREMRTAMALMITTNNISVGTRAFVFGIAGGFPAILIIAFNGYLLGAVGYLYFHTAPGFNINLPLYFLAGVIPHGALELPAICLAGAAGMLLGFSWVFPGVRSRGRALRQAVPDALKLLATSAITLIIAGIIEGFITPLQPPAHLPIEWWFFLKILFGLLMLGAWLIWLNHRDTTVSLAPEEKYRSYL